MSAGIQDVCKYLNSLGISYRLLRHEAVVTCEQSHEIIRVADCSSCKSLLVKDKKSDRYFMIVLRSDKRAEMRNFALVVGIAKFEFATEDKLREISGVERGSVSPFCYLNESCNIAPLMLDRDILTAKYVKFHPCDNTATLVLTVADFLKYLGSINIEPILLTSSQD
ncbi:MAG: YbaK/EbsC family protein [Clostridia bacterium]